MLVELRGAGMEHLGHSSSGSQPVGARVVMRCVLPADCMFALDLYQFDEQMQRSRLRRERPGASEKELDAAVRAWCCARPERYRDCPQ